jgi:hypothetical protein
MSLIAASAAGSLGRSGATSEEHGELVGPPRSLRTETTSETVEDVYCVWHKGTAVHHGWRAER